ncbi:MAG: hypothetical protein D6708_02845 [Candidatus Dadabacteria bacterium]|nr:MAG: hypothetical protein D6708_02845 [Candidatus Dadabacteria bacterium]
MCHVSVGHVARTLEDAGLPTVAIYVKAFARVAREMHLPRVLLTPHPLGRPLGAPGDRERQSQVLRAALDLLETAEANGALREFPLPYRPRPA